MGVGGTWHICHRVNNKNFQKAGVGGARADLETKVWSPLVFRGINSSLTSSQFLFPRGKGPFIHIILNMRLTRALLI